MRRMRPLLLLIGALVVMLAIATLISRRRSRALEAPQPQPLGDAERAAIAGMDEATLPAAESMQRVVRGKRSGAHCQSGALKQGCNPTLPYGGKGGIRTHGEVPPTTVFKTVALNHSATFP